MLIIIFEYASNMATHQKVSLLELGLLDFAYYNWLATF
jgi:hypothetical protein